MVATLISALVAAAPIAGMSSEALDAKIAEVHRTPAFGDRVEALSKLFIGTPYGEFPLGEGSGIEPQPRWRTDKVDCQTYVETVLAMANARSLDEAKSVLDDIRYQKPPVSFANRNHFTEAQWLPANIDKGYVRDEAISIDGNAPAETLVLHKAQWARVKGLQRLEAADIPEGKFSIRYLPIAQAKRKAASIEPGTILMVVREHDANRVVRVSHMGFVVRGPRGLVVRHASTGAEHAVIDEDFFLFLDKQAEYRKWKVVGVALAMPLDATLRLSQISKG
jgi:hypothetical protein